jgi:hypothetical protein
MGNFFVEDKMRRFKGDCAQFSCNKCLIYTYDGASANFSTNSHEMDNSAQEFMLCSLPQQFRQCSLPEQLMACSLPQQFICMYTVQCSLPQEFRQFSQPQQFRQCSLPHSSLGSVHYHSLFEMNVFFSTYSPKKLQLSYFYVVLFCFFRIHCFWIFFSSPTPPPISPYFRPLKSMIWLFLSVLRQIFSSSRPMPKHFPSHRINEYTQEAGK